jgi:transposase-like protein
LAVVKSDLDDIPHAETRAEAETALTVFSETYGVKYEKGVVCLTKARETDGVQPSFWQPRRGGSD